MRAHRQYWWVFSSLHTNNRISNRTSFEESEWVRKRENNKILTDILGNIDVHCWSFVFFFYCVFFIFHCWCCIMFLYLEIIHKKWFMCIISFTFNEKKICKNRKILSDTLRMQLFFFYCSHLLSDILLSSVIAT